MIGNMGIIVPAYLYENGTQKNKNCYLNPLRFTYDTLELDSKKIDRDMLIKVYISLQLYGTAMRNGGRNGFNAKIKIDSIRQLCIDMKMSYQSKNIAKIKETLMILKKLSLIDSHRTEKNTFYIASKFENAYKILGQISDNEKYYTGLTPHEANYLIQNKISLSIYCLLKALQFYGFDCSKEFIKIVTGFSNNKINKAINDMKDLKILNWEGKNNKVAKWRINDFEIWEDWWSFEI